MTSSTMNDPWCKGHFKLSESAKMEKTDGAFSENDGILKLYHAAQNHFQVISSLLSAYSKQTEDGYARQAFEKSLTQVRAIALAYEKFYQTIDEKEFEVGRCLPDLAERILESFSPNSGFVELTVDCDPLLISCDRILPLSLILNELMSTTLQYPFADPQPRAILITYRSLSEDLCELKYSDKGTGIVQALPEDSPEFKLLILLARQINATVLNFESSNDKGYSFLISLP